MNEAVENLRSLSDRVEQLKPEVEADLKKWLDIIERTKPSDSDSTDTKLNHRQQALLSDRIENSLKGLNEEIKIANESYAKEFEGDSERRSQDDKTPSEDDEEGDQKDKDEYDVEDYEAVGPEDTPAVEKWKKIQEMVTSPGGLSDRVSTLLIFQTQIRLFLIEIKPLEIEEEQAVKIALENRLDLMNSRGAVVDAYRQVEIAADQLESDLDINASANLLTDPNRDNAFRFDGDENEYALGFSFDGPLNLSLIHI